MANRKFLSVAREAARDAVKEFFRPLPRLTWRQPGGLPECPYFHRWVLDFGPFAIRLHHWHGSDDQRAFHDHAFWFLTLVLWGSYIDRTPRGNDYLRMGSIRYRPANHVHTVQITTPGTWTLLLTGPSVHRWGFWLGGKYLKRDKYFAVMGHHPCDPTDAPVRKRPDGSVISSLLTDHSFEEETHEAGTADLGGCGSGRSRTGDERAGGGDRVRPRAGRTSAEPGRPDPASGGAGRTGGDGRA